MAVSAIAASQPAIAATQSTAGRRSTLEQLLGGIGSFRTALRSLGILANPPAPVAPVSPDGAGTAGVAATVLLLAPPSAFAATESAAVSAPPEAAATPSATTGASASPTSYTQLGTPVFRHAAPTLDLTV